MAPLSNKFFNLMVLLLVVPAIIVALDADISANAAPFKRMERRSAFLASDDIAVEARDLSKISHEHFGREHTDREMALVRRMSKATKGFLKFIKGVGHVFTGRSPAGMAVKAASHIAQSAGNNHNKRERDEYPRRPIHSRPATSKQQTLAESSSGHDTHSVKQVTGVAGGPGVHAVPINSHKESVNVDHPHYNHDQDRVRHTGYNYDSRVHQYNHLKNGHHASDGGFNVPQPHSRHTSQLRSHHDTEPGVDSISKHEQSHGAAPAIPPSTVEHRRSFYYDMEDLD